MASLRRKLIPGRRGRLGKALGLLFIQDQSLANSKGGAFQRQSFEGLKDTILAFSSCSLSTISPKLHVHETRLYSTHQNNRHIGLTQFTATCSPYLVQPYWTSLRYYSTSEDKDKQLSGDQEEKEKKVEVKEEHPGIFKRFKNAYKEYGKVLICVHVATSCMWFGSFFYAAYSGIDIVPILHSMGFNETLIKPFTMPGVGNAAVAYLMYKLATPVRYTVTIAGTQLTVRQLRRLGYMKPVPEGHSIRDLAKASASQMRDRYEDRKDKYADLVKDKYSDVKLEVKDRYSDLKGDLKVKVTGLKGDIKHRYEERKDRYSDLVKDKYSDVKLEVKDKYSDIKGDIKVKVTGLKGDIKNKYSDMQGEFKEKMGSLKEDVKGKRDKLSQK